MEDCDDETDQILKVIPSHELKLIPLGIIITHIYNRIIEQASICESSYDFSIDKLITHYGINTKIITTRNKTYVVNEIKRLFPGIRITEIIGKTSCSMYNSYFNACWDDDVDDEHDNIDENIVEDTLNSYEDIILNQAIQESLKEVKKPQVYKKKYYV